MTLTVRGIWKTYNRHFALRGVDLQLKDGVVALLGPNGSGKTTLLRILATILAPDRGEIILNQRNYAAELRPIRCQLGYLPQDLHLPEYLTPFKLLRYLAHLKGMVEDRQFFNSLVDLKLLPLVDRPFSQLSAGQVRLIGVAQAFLGNPRLQLLDELTRSLDVQERELVFRLVQRQAQDRLVIFSTHVPADVENLAQELIVLKEGRVLYCGGVGGFCSRVDEMVFEVRLPAERAAEIMQTYPVSRVREEGYDTVLRVVGTPPDGYPAIPVSATLEDAYIYTFKKVL